VGKSYDIGPRIGIEGEGDFRKTILNLQSVVNTLGLEMQATARDFDKNDKSVENLTGQNKLLNKQIEAQKEVLTVLNKGLEYAESNYGSNDKRTQEWKQAVLQANMKLRDMEDAVRANNDALSESIRETKRTRKETDELGDSAKKTGGKFKDFFKTLGSATLKTIGATFVAIGTAVAAAAASMFRLTESTKEYRLDLSKLEQNSKTANLNYEKMKGHVRELTALTGEMDSSIEAVSDLMAIGFDENGMAKAVDALAGAAIRFPDTLKIEGLADGLQETLATGKAIGPFAELIDRLGGSTEEFDKKMAEATTDAERQQVALQFLADNGLANINEEYKKTNEAMLAAAEAQLKLDDALANIAAAVEPFVATIKSGAADALTALIGMASGTEGAAGEFETSLSTLINGIVGQIETIIPIVSTILETVVPILLNGVIAALPQMVSTAVILLNALVSGILSNLPLIASSALTLVMSLTTMILENLPLLVEGAVQIVVALATGIGAALPELIPTIVMAALTIVQGLLDNLGLIIDAGLQIVIGLALGIINSLPLLFDKAPELIQSLISGIMSAIPQLMSAATSIIVGLIEYITDGENIANIITMAVQLVLAIVTGLIQALPELVLATPQMIAAIVDAFIETDWASLGGDIIDGIAEGVVDAAKNLAEAAKQAAKEALDGVKSLLKINSPSQVTRDEIGKMMGAGIAEGLIDSGEEIKYALGEVTRKVTLDADYSGSSSVNDYMYDYSQRVEQNINVNGDSAIEWERRMNALAIQQLEMMVRG